MGLDDLRAFMSAQPSAIDVWRLLGRVRLNRLDSVVDGDCTWRRFTLAPGSFAVSACAILFSSADAYCTRIHDDIPFDSQAFTNTEEPAISPSMLLSFS